MATIQGIYIALFGRPADPIGLAFFNEATNNGADLSAIGDLAGTAEYQSRFEGMNNAQIVTEIYLSLFGRPPELAGLQFFVAQLESGAQNINTIAINILDGAQNEDADVVANKIAAAEAWTAAVAADPAALAAYQGQAGIDAGIAYLSGITDDEDTIPTEAEVDAALSLLIAGEPPAGTPGQTFTLTTGVDEIVGTSGDDTFRAFDSATLQSFDILDGGTGNDVLNIRAGAIADNAAPVIHNIETINNAHVGATLGLGSTTGVDAIWTDMTGFTGIAATRYNDASVATIFGIKGAEGTNNDVNITFADSLEGDTTVNLALEGNAAGSYAGFYLEEGVENAVITVAEGNGGFTTVSGVSSVTASGAGDFGFYTWDNTTIESFDASAVTGDVYLTGFITDAVTAATFAEDANIITGAGDDELYLDTSTGDLTIDGGAGNDIIVSGSGDDTIIAGTGVNTLTGGAGADTFVISIGGTTLGQADFITDWDADEDTLIIGDTELTDDNYFELDDTDAASYNDLLDLVNSEFVLNEDAEFVYGVFQGGAGAGAFIFHDADGDNVADAVVRVADFWFEVA